MKTSEILARAATSIACNGHRKGPGIGARGERCAVVAMINVVDSAETPATRTSLAESLRSAETALAAVIDNGRPRDAWIDAVQVITNWNDHPDRSGAEVVSAMNEAARMAEAHDGS